MGCLSSKVATEVVEEVMTETVGSVVEAAIDDVVEDILGDDGATVEVGDNAAEASDAGAIPRPAVAVRNEDECSTGSF